MRTQLSSCQGWRTDATSNQCTWVLQVLRQVIHKNGHSTLLRYVLSDPKLNARYDLVNTEIRKHDRDHLVLFESVTWEIVGIGEQFGFTHSPGGEEWVNKWVCSRFSVKLTSSYLQVRSRLPQLSPRPGEIPKYHFPKLFSYLGDLSCRLLRLAVKTINFTKCDSRN